MSSNGNLFFSLDEAKEPHPAIYEIVRYWEDNRLRIGLPVEKKNIASGFLLEYGNSGFKDYHSIIGIDTGKAIRVLIDRREPVLTDEDIKRLRTMFATLGHYTTGGKNINYYVKDGNVYLLTLITENGVSKIPYYSPDLDQKNERDEIALLRNLLYLEKAFGQ